MSASEKPRGHDRHGKRGRHKKATSPEAKAWLAEHAPPERPAWLPRETYLRLMEMRNGD